MAFPRRRPPFPPFHKTPVFFHNQNPIGPHEQYAGPNSTEPETTPPAREQARHPPNRHTPLPRLPEGTPAPCRQPSPALLSLDRHQPRRNQSLQPPHATSPSTHRSKQPKTRHILRRQQRHERITRSLATTLLRPQQDQPTRRRTTCLEASRIQDHHRNRPNKTRKLPSQTPPRIPSHHQPSQQIPQRQEHDTTRRPLTRRVQRHNCTRSPKRTRTQRTKRELGTIHHETRNLQTISKTRTIIQKRRHSPGPRNHHLLSRRIPRSPNLHRTQAPRLSSSEKLSGLMVRMGQHIQRPRREVN